MAARQHAALVVVLATCHVSLISPSLIINVSSGDTDSNVYRQTVAGNISEDTVTISFISAEGRGVTQLTDFRARLTITAVTVPGEEDLGEPGYQVLCFVSPGVGDVIAPEPVTKLRQKHSGAVRVAEESRGRVVVEHSASLVPSRAHHLSANIGQLCREARETTFVPEFMISQLKDGAVGYKTAARKDPSYLIVSHSDQYAGLPRCATLPPVSSAEAEACLCVVDTCVLWYPCSLKYCRNGGAAADTGEHRCGIRTCSKCSEMRFIAQSKHDCSWDEL